MDIQITPYKNTNSTIEKYHIIRLDSSQIIYRVCNLIAPFGRQTEHQTSINITQHRLNIGFSCDQIASNNKSYLEIIRIINELESFFKTFDELKDYELVSNIINRNTFGIVIRLHLKTQNDRTTTPLIHMINSIDSNTEWIEFDKTKQINIDISPDCLWIDNKNKKYGVSFVIHKVFQFIS